MCVIFHTTHYHKSMCVPHQTLLATETSKCQRLTSNHHHKVSKCGKNNWGCTFSYGSFPFMVASRLNRLQNLLIISTNLILPTDMQRESAWIFDSLCWSYSYDPFAFSDSEWCFLCSWFGRKIQFLSRELDSTNSLLFFFIIVSCASCVLFARLKTSWSEPSPASSTSR